MVCFPFNFLFVSACQIYFVTVSYFVRIPWSFPFTTRSTCFCFSLNFFRIFLLIRFISLYFHQFSFCFLKIHSRFSTLSVSSFLCSSYSLFLLFLLQFSSYFSPYQIHLFTTSTSSILLKLIQDFLLFSFSSSLRSLYSSFLLFSLQFSICHVCFFTIAIYFPPIWSEPI